MPNGYGNFWRSRGHPTKRELREQIQGQTSIISRSFRLQCTTVYRVLESLKG